MISKDKFLKNVQEIAASKPSYELGHDGSDGTCDCIGLIIGAIRRAGGSWTGIHGSNYAARHEMRQLLPVTDAGELCLGDVVYKARTPGQAGYALPERYKNDPDQRDYYHVGVVTAVEPLEITHCTGPGIVRDTKLGKWTYRGRLEKVDYDGTSQEVGTMVADGHSGGGQRKQGKDAQQAQHVRRVVLGGPGGGNGAGSGKHRRLGEGAVWRQDGLYDGGIPEDGCAGAASCGKLIRKCWRGIDYRTAGGAAGGV